MSWTEGRRIRRVRKPTPWQRWVVRWHTWLEDALEKAVCCGADPVSLSEADSGRMSLGGKQPSSVFSIRSMSAYGQEDDSDFDDTHDLLSDTGSESSEEFLPSSNRSDSIDMERRYSAIDLDTPERQASFGSEYIPFDEEEQDRREGHSGGADHFVTPISLPVPDSPIDNPACTLQHRMFFNCVLAELLMASHPAILAR